jgi:hypothetical protein
MLSLKVEHTALCIARRTTCRSRRLSRGAPTPPCSIPPTAIVTQRSSDSSETDWLRVACIVGAGSAMVSGSGMAVVSGVGSAMVIGIAGGGGVGGVRMPGVCADSGSGMVSWVSGATVVTGSDVDNGMLRGAVCAASVSMCAASVSRVVAALTIPVGVNNTPCVWSSSLVCCEEGTDVDCAPCRVARGEGCVVFFFRTPCRVLSASLACVYRAVRKALHFTNSCGDRCFRALRIAVL